MSLYKIGSSLYITKTAASATELLIDRPLLEQPEVVENKNNEFLYFVAKGIAAGDEGPVNKEGKREWNQNGNGDFFPKKEIEAAMPGWIGKGLYLDHNAESVIYSVGKIIDVFPTVDPENKEWSVSCLCKLDTLIHPEIARKISTGELNTVSMGCSCEESRCNICGTIVRSDSDEKCAHMEGFGINKKYAAEIDLPEYGIKRGDVVPSFAINSGLAFNELSLVGVPAWPRAFVTTILSNIKSRLSKTASLSKEEQLDLAAQMEKLFEKLDESTKISLKAEFCGICPQPIKESSMSDMNLVPSDEQKKILSKISALEMEQLESYVAHKTKKANEIINKEVVADATKKEETFLSKIVAKVKDSFAAQLLEKKVEAVAKEELGKESKWNKCRWCGLANLPHSDLCKKCKEESDKADEKDKELYLRHQFIMKKDKESSLSAKFNEDKNNVLVSTWSVYEGERLVLDASLKDIWGSQFEILSFADQKWATSEAYGKEAIARYQKEGIEKLADLWDVSHKLSKVAKEYQPKTGEPCSCRPGIARDNCPECEGTGQKIDFKKIRESSLKTAKGPEFGPDGSYAKPNTGLSNKEHSVKNSPVEKPGQEQAQKGPAAPAGTDAKTDPQFKMPGQEKGQTGPAAPKPKEVKTDYSEPKPEAEGKEVKTTPKNPEEKKLEKSEKEVETSYVAKGTEAMEAEEKDKKEDKKEEKKASINYKEANAQIKWSAMSPAAQEFIKEHVSKHIKEDGMEQAQAVRVAYEEARAKGMDVPAAPKESSQEPIMEKKATEKPVESVEESTIPDGKKSMGDKPEEAVQGTTLPEEGKAATPETSAEGDKANKTPNLTVAPEEAVQDKPTEVGKEKNPDEAVADKPVCTTPNLTSEPDKAVKTAAAELPIPEDKPVIEEKPEVPAEHETENLALDVPVEPVSAFDKVDKFEIGDGYSAHKDLETKEIIVEKEGKEVKRLPDGFSGDKTVVLSLMRTVLGLPLAEEPKPEVPGVIPPPVEEKVEEPKVEEHPALEEAHEDELGIKESALKEKKHDCPKCDKWFSTQNEAVEHMDKVHEKEAALAVKEAELIAKEAEIKAKEESARKVEASKKFAEVLKVRSERCKKIVAEMVNKGAIQLDKETYEYELKNGTYLLDAQKKAFEFAISAKQKEFLAMNDEALLATEKVVADLKAPVVKKASHIFVSPSYGEELSEDQQLKKIFDTMGNPKQHPQ